MRATASMTAGLLLIAGLVSTPTVSSAATGGEQSVRAACKRDRLYRDTFVVRCRQAAPKTQYRAYVDCSNGESHGNWKRQTKRFRRDVVSVARCDPGGIIVGRLKIHFR